jgi:regulator of nonsense transcripts 3
VKEQAVLDALSAKVRQTTFQDAKNTTKDPCLLAPPSVEFAPLNKVPGGRIRHDGRQGTIDQDPEFIDFLQSLTEPISKPGAQGGDGGDTKANKATTTPLIQFIKEKKAAKAKEAALAKSAKGRQDGKDAKGTKAEQKSITVIKNTASPATEKARVAKATQETVKAINKSVAAMQVKGGTQKTEPKAAAVKDTSVTQPPAKRERERGNASVAARILQRDLGIIPKESKAARALRNAAPPEDADKAPKVNLPSSTAPPTPQPQSPPVPPTGPRNTRPASAVSNKPAPAPAQRPPKPPPQLSAGAKSAFLKHANPSQGITEELLRTAFEVFGTLTRCEIDKKKGFGYVDFRETEGLRKAINASPVKVANGQVVVLENKSKPPSKGGPASVPCNAPSVQVQSQSQTTPSTSEPPPTPTTSSTTTAVPASATTSETTTPTTAPPTAPKGGVRGGHVNRANRGGHLGGPNRGNFGPGNRGAPRGTFRSGSRGSPANRGGGGRGGNNSANSPAQANIALITPASTAAAAGEEK